MKLARYWPRKLTPSHGMPPRYGVVVGDRVVDFSAITATGLLARPDLPGYDFASPLLGQRVLSVAEDEAIREIAQRTMATLWEVAARGLDMSLPLPLVVG